MQPVGLERRNETHELSRGVDKANASPPTRQLSRGLHKRRELAHASPRLGGRYLAAAWPHVGRVANHELCLPSTAESDVAHVAMHDLAPTDPAVRVQVSSCHRGRRLVNLDEDYVPRRAKPQKRQPDSADTGPEIIGERQSARSASSDSSPSCRRRRCSKPCQEQGVDVGAIASAPLRLKEDDLATEKGIPRGARGNVVECAASECGHVQGLGNGWRAAR